MIALASPRLLRHQILVLFSVLAALLWAGAAYAQPSFPERGTAPVLDQANIIDEATEAELTMALDSFEERNQRQFVIVTLDSLQGYDIADYGYQLGRYWALGDAENNDGIILIVAPNERKMRIEVGYGLEPIIPDGLAFEYIEGMKPFFRNGDYSGGISWGAMQILNQLELPPEQAAIVVKQVNEGRQNDSGIPFGAIIWLGFILFFFVLPMLRGRGRKRRYRGAADTVGDIILWEVGSAIVRGAMDNGGSSSGGWSGGGGGFGGGFSGGGGSFGGGGASGGW